MHCLQRYSELFKIFSFSGQINSSLLLHLLSSLSVFCILGFCGPEALHQFIKTEFKQGLEEWTLTLPISACGTVVFLHFFVP